MDYKNILKNSFPDEEVFFTNKKLLVVMLGVFADFDSFEYAQQLSALSKKITNSSIEIIAIGIGNQKSKEYFCHFNKLDLKNVLAIKNDYLHRIFNLNRGLTSPMPAILNLLIMCTGINSKGTIKEVLRGYLGDKKAKSIFTSDQIIKLGQYSLFKGKMFNIFSEEDILRPFELATRRLLNMIEIISNWTTYVPDESFLTQRGATILINEKDEILYKFSSDSLLGYSKNMSKPLSFLDVYLK